MEYFTRAAVWGDLEDLCAIELSAMPNYANYMRDAAEYFFKTCPGEMVLVQTKEGESVGMGRFSLLPDGSGWLEILRVRAEWQRRGVGRAIYKRYMELASSANAPYVGMFTGRTNIASKSLAEAYGFKLAAAYLNKELTLPQNAPPADEAFKQITNVQEGILLLQKTAAAWGPHVSLNRTFYRHTVPFYKWLIESGMLCSDGENIVVLGARMLKERGINLGLVHGEVKKCVEFAIDKAAEMKVNKMACLCPPNRQDVLAALEECGFSDAGELIVIEWQKE